MLEDSQPMTVEYAKPVYYHESECDMKFDRSEQTATTAVEPVNAIVAVVIKPEAQLTAEELVQQTTNGHEEGQHANHPPRVSSHDVMQTAVREVRGIVKLPTSSFEQIEPIMVTYKSLPV